MVIEYMVNGVKYIEDVHLEDVETSAEYLDKIIKENKSEEEKSINEKR